ncbi:MAG: hypothetical protein GX892_09835 [Thermoanaerobacteraceae bacterium]|nr:hypothetical protein [Thermoanaerobacteraceae bacterium]
MSYVIEEVKKAMEGIGIVTVPSENPNKLFVVYEIKETRFVMMINYSEKPKIMYITSEIPVEFSADKEESAFLASAYINRSLNFGSATYWSDINRIVFRFYCNMDEENLNLGMFFDCYYEAIDLVKRFYPIVELLEKGAVRPQEVVEMERNNLAK